MATEATVLRIELWCARDVLSSFVRFRDLARMSPFNEVAVAVSAGCAWLLATAFSAGPGVIAIAGLLIYNAVDIAAAVAPPETTRPSCCSERPRGLAAQLGAIPSSFLFAGAL